MFNPLFYTCKLSILKCQPHVRLFIGGFILGLYYDQEQSHTYGIHIYCIHLGTTLAPQSTFLQECTFDILIEQLYRILLKKEYICLFDYIHHLIEPKN